MALFERDRDKRRAIGIVVAMAAHVERNTPQIFPKATTDRLELAAEELLGDERLGPETVIVCKRILAALRARPNSELNYDRNWLRELTEVMEEFNEHW